MEESPKRVECPRHGTLELTFVCGHVAKGEGLGWVTAHDPGNPYPHAWCETCDRVLREERMEWNDRSEGFAEITMACSGCYEEFRHRNQRAADIDRADV